MITPDSPIVGPPSGALADALDFAPRLAQDYLKELWRLCLLVGFDPAILAAQSAHETANWQSFWWKSRRNPAGIGITGDDEQDERSQVWAMATDAARGHVAHMWAYVYGWNIVEWDLAYGLTDFDKRWEIAAAAYGGDVVALRDLTGKWATDPAYHDKIVRKHAAMFGAKEQPVATTPVIYDLSKDYARFGLTVDEAELLMTYRFRNRYDAYASVQGEVDSIVFHIQDGTTKSSLDWWVNGYTATGEKVQASATVMIQKDGSILRVIDEQHGPWTNGDDLAPTPAGQRLVNRPGNSNIYSLTIEFEAMKGELLTAAQIVSGVWQVRQWEAQFPKVKPNDRKLQHADLSRFVKAACPGDGVYNQLMSALAIPTAPAEPTPFPIPWKRGDLGPRKLGTQPAVAYLVELTAIKDINTYVAADPKSKRGPRVKMKDKVVSLGAVQGERNVYEIVDLGDGKPWRVARHAFTPKQLPKP